jgi:hypothetical protein
MHSGTTFGVVSHSNATVCVQTRWSIACVAKTLVLVENAGLVISAPYIAAHLSWVTGYTSEKIKITLRGLECACARHINTRIDLTGLRGSRDFIIRTIK